MVLPSRRVSYNSPEPVSADESMGWETSGGGGGIIFMVGAWGPHGGGWGNGGGPARGLSFWRSCAEGVVGSGDVIISFFMRGRTGLAFVGITLAAPPPSVCCLLADDDDLTRSQGLVRIATNPWISAEVDKLATPPLLFRLTSRGQWPPAPSAFTAAADDVEFETWAAVMGGTAEFVEVKGRALPDVAAILANE